MCEFSRSDVITIAKALSEDCITFSRESYDEYFLCSFCYSSSINKCDIKHEKDCPVIIAQNILTKNESRITIEKEN